MNMHRTRKIDGISVSFKRSIIGWVACFGLDYFVHFRQPIKGGVWVARRPIALENICNAPTLDECVRKVRRHHDAIEADVRTRMAARLARI